MARIPARDLLCGLQRTLCRVGLDYERIIIEFGQVSASEARERGDPFPLSSHVRGLILSQLSNQRPWKPIAANLPRIQRILLDYNPDALEAADPVALGQALMNIRCGNRKIACQMEALAENIRTFRTIESIYGSMDEFVTSADPNTIASQLAQPGRFKLREVGYALAMEYLRNVGIRASKPDVHVRRILSGERLGYVDCIPSEAQAYHTVGDLAEEADCNATYLDNLLWLFCAQGYGNVCGAVPRCAVCEFRSTCNYPRARGESTKEAL